MILGTWSELGVYDDGVDTAAPVITLNGAASITLTVGDTYTDAGATTDDGSTVVVSGTVDTNTAATYTITYNATDTAGNVATQVTRTVIVQEVSTGLVLSSAGQKWVSLPVYTFPSGSLYVEIDFTVTQAITQTNQVFKLRNGAIEFSYRFDATGQGFLYVQTNTDAVEITAGTFTLGQRTVLRADLNLVSGLASVSVNGGAAIATATVETPEDFVGITTTLGTDTSIGNADGIIFLDAELHTFDINNQRTYVVDNVGTTATVLAETTGGFDGDIISAGVDTVAPVITLNPNQTTFNINAGDSFVAPVGTSTDAFDGQQIITPSGTVDANTEGTYTLTYTDSDAAGNVATPVIVTVNVSAAVADTTAPVITVSGSASTTIAFGAAIPTFTASTDDGSTVVVGGDSVNNNLAGTYVITYDATDNAGNTATQVTRTVIVEADLQLIQSIARAEFTLDGDGRFIRLTGRSNQSKFGFKVIDSTGNITLTQAGHFDWDSNSVDKVEMIVGDSIISSDDGAVSFSDDFMYAELGLLDGFGQQPLRVIVYAAGDTKGTAIAGPNLSAAPIISMV